MPEASVGCAVCGSYEHVRHPSAAPWEVRNSVQAGEHVFSIQRGTALDCETAAVCWDYGLACLIEAAVNLRDGTVE